VADDSKDEFEIVSILFGYFQALFRVEDDHCFPYPNSDVARSKLDRPDDPFFFKFRAVS
jgi:hypothetical protein